VQLTRIVNLVTSVFAALMCSACTMLMGVERFVPEDPPVDQVRSVRFEPYRHAQRWGGTSGGLELASGDRRIRVSSDEYAWYQYSWGVIFPVFPIGHAVGPYRTELVIRLSVESASTLISCEARAIRIQTAGASESCPPVRWSLDTPPRFCADYPVVGDEDVLSLATGQGVWLVFDLDNDATAEFDLVLPLAPEPLRLHFRKERTKFLESWL
jgi:hypothetical protein